MKLGPRETMTLKPHLTFLFSKMFELCSFPTPDTVPAFQDDDFSIRGTHGKTTRVKTHHCRVINVSWVGSETQKREYQEDWEKKRPDR